MLPQLGLGTVTWPQLKAFMDKLAAERVGEDDAYGLSKAVANAYTLRLAREHPHLQINACTPGFIETDLTRPYLIGSDPVGRPRRRA